MREITTHKVNGCNEAITIHAIDQPGSGGACHAYQLSGFDTATNPSCPYVKLFGKPAVDARILFQNGPVGEVGTNGVTHEALLAIVIDRLEGFQSGPFACAENTEALVNLRAAQNCLKSRTLKRVARGVEGTHAV